MTLFGTGCSTDRDPATLFAPDAVGVLVIDATMIVGDSFPKVRLTRTLAPNVPYTLADAHEYGADMEISWSGGVVRYQESLAQYEDEFVAFYSPMPGTTGLVRQGTQYDITVTTTNGQALRATTLTPTNFSVEDWVLLSSDGSTVVRELRTFAELGDGAYTHPDNQLIYAEGLVDGRLAQPAEHYGAYGFQVALFSLDPEAGYVIDPPFFEPEDFLDLPREGSSPILSGVDESLRLPWFSVFFDGRHLFKAFAVDRNWYDLERTIPQGGGSFVFGGNVGEGVDPPLFHVEGGIGLFGSAAVDSLGVSIVPLQP